MKNIWSREVADLIMLTAKRRRQRSENLHGITYRKIYRVIIAVIRAVIIMYFTQRGPPSTWTAANLNMETTSTSETPAEVRKSEIPIFALLSLCG